MLAAIESTSTYSADRLSPTQTQCTEPQDAESSLNYTARSGHCDSPPSCEDMLHVYENIGILERAGDDAPIPDVDDTCVRTLPGGWQEFTSDTGRAYFFHPHSGHSQWKPPRQLASPEQVAVFLQSGNEDGLDPSTTAGHCPPLPLSMHSMQESVDSGLGRTSLSLKNQAYGLRMTESTYDAYLSSEEVAVAMDGQGTNLAGSANTVPKTIKRGNLDRCKIAEAGHKMKKREWTPTFLFLSSAHIIFYKDEKSAEKYGKHYPAPLGVCDLRGARLSWFDKEKSEKRRKHVFQLDLADGTIYLFSTTNSQEVNSWFHGLRQVIAKLPQPDFYPTPVLEDGTGSLSRTASTLSRKQATTSSTVINTSSLRHSTKVKGKVSRDAGSYPPQMEDLPTRQTIIDRLRRFFRNRPSLETLSEQGIYRREPVFGNTLTSICQQETSNVPRFIQIVTEVIESRGLDTDGLYRVSGNLSSVQKIRCQVDQDKYSALIAEDDVHVLTGALKLFFRELSEPLFPAASTKAFFDAIKQQNPKQRMRAFEELLQKLPIAHRDTLKVLLKHLLRVASHADKNRMQIHNLAIMFGPSLFGHGDRVTPPVDSQSGKRVGKAGSTKPVAHAPVQSNSHLAFSMILQGQIIEYLLNEHAKFPILVAL